LPNVTHLFADLAYVQWVVVAPGLGLGMLLIRILPSLQILRFSMIRAAMGRGRGRRNQRRVANE
jgi:hypothetical protein